MSAVTEFVQDPLTTWFASCLEDALLGVEYHDIIDGVLLHKIFVEINPNPLHNNITYSGGDPMIRTKNLELIVKNIQNFYEEKLGHVLLQKPDAKTLGQDPEMYTDEAKLLLLLLLGAAVQCPNKEKFITNIQALSNDIQVSLIQYIQKVTECQEIVLTQEYVDTDKTGSVFTLLKKLVQNQNMLVEKQQEISEVYSLNACEYSNNHCTTESGDWNVKTRKLRQELEEKNEMIHEYEKDLEGYKILLKEVDAQNQELIVEARAARAYRDELDVAVQSVERAERLEAEVAKYREKLNDLEYYKSRTRELKEDSEVLLATKEVLEEQLAAQMERTSTIDDLHEELENYKQAIKEMKEKNSKAYEKYHILREENAHLRRVNKELLSGCSSSTDTVSECEDMVMNDALSEQLNISVQSRTLKRQLEYHRRASVSQSLEEYEEEEEEEEKEEEVDEEKEGKEEEGSSWEIMKPDLYRHHRSTSRSQVNMEQMTSKYTKLEASVFLLESQKQKLQDDVQKIHEIIKDNELKLSESQKKFDNLSKEMKENEARYNSEVQQKLQICLQSFGLDANIVMKLTSDEIVDTITKNFTGINTVKREISDATDFTNQEIIDDMNVNIHHLQSKLVSVQSESEYQISENMKLKALLSSMELSKSEIHSEKDELQIKFSSMTRDYDALIDVYDCLKTAQKQFVTKFQKLLNERDALSAELVTLRKTLEKGDDLVDESEMDYECEISDVKVSQFQRNERRDDFSSQHDGYDKLHLIELENRISELENENSIKDKKIKHTELEVQKAKQCCHVLSRNNSDLEREKQSLLQHLFDQSRRYKHLLNKWLGDKKCHESEGKMYRDELTALHMEKSFLERVIAQRHAVFEKSAKHKKVLGSNFLRRVQKAVQTSDLFKKNRRWSPKNTVNADNEFVHSPNFLAFTDSEINSQRSRSGRVESDSNNVVIYEDSMLFSKSLNTRKSMFNSKNNTLNGTNREASSAQYDVVKINNDTNETSASNMIYSEPQRSYDLSHENPIHNTSVSNMYSEITPTFQSFVNYRARSHSISPLNKSTTSHKSQYGLVSSTNKPTGASTPKMAESSFNNYAEIRTSPPSPTEWNEQGCV